MPSVISHAVVGAALGAALLPAQAPRRLWLLGATCAMLPDADSIGFQLGIPYGHLLGHRGLTHSLPFALALSALLVVSALPNAQRHGARGWLVLYFFAATASHGILDAMTNGGLGIALFAPFDQTRYFFPFRPIEVSPLSMSRFFSRRGLVILASELRWIWLPALLMASLGRRRRAGSTPQ